MDDKFADIFASSFTKFKNYLRGRFSELSEYDAEDIIQQTALNMLGKSGGVDYATSYIYSALQNGAKNFFRKHNREVVIDEIDAGNSGSAEDELISKELKSHIKDAIAMLDEKSRFVFVETEIGGKSYKELSEQTGEPVGTLLSRKSRATKKLMMILEAYKNL